MYETTLYVCFELLELWFNRFVKITFLVFVWIEFGLGQFTLDFGLAMFNNHDIFELLKLFLYIKVFKLVGIQLVDPLLRSHEAHTLYSVHGFLFQILSHFLDSLD